MGRSADTWAIGVAKRDPASAGSYFAEIGLTGEFWAPNHS